MKRALAFSLALALMVGCATVQTATEFRGTSVNGNPKPVTSIAIENSGWYIFGVLPIITGDPAHPGPWSFRLFRNTVTLENNIKMLQMKADEFGATNLENLESWTDDNLSIGLFVLGIKSIYTAAVISDAAGDRPGVRMGRLAQDLGK